MKSVTFLSKRLRASLSLFTALAVLPLGSTFQSVQAKPKSSAPAWGYRAKSGSKTYKRNGRTSRRNDRNTSRSNRRIYDRDRRSNDYDRRSNDYNRRSNDYNRDYNRNRPGRRDRREPGVYDPNLDYDRDRRDRREPGVYDPIYDPSDDPSYGPLYR